MVQQASELQRKPTCTILKLREQNAFKQTKGKERNREEKIILNNLVQLNSAAHIRSNAIRFSQHRV